MNIINTPNDDYHTTVLKDDLIVQRPYPDDGRWYVQQVALMDMGRFMTYEEALDHAKFLQSKTST